MVDRHHQTVDQTTTVFGKKTVKKESKKTGKLNWKARRLKTLLINESMVTFGMIWLGYRTFIKSISQSIYRPLLSSNTALII